MSHYLIVGCGYLGQRVAGLLLAAGHRVSAATRRPERAAELAALGIEPVMCEVTDAPLRLPEVDGVVHCVGWDRAGGRTFRQVYVDGLGNVADASMSAAKIVHVSSTSVYGQTAGEDVDEAGETTPVEDSGKVVLEAERLLRSKRPDAVILRFAGIYGPGRLLRESALRKGERLGPGASHWLNLIHIDDGAAAVAAALDRASAGSTFNVADGHPVRRLDVYLYLARLLNTGPPVFTIGEGGKQSNRRVVARRMREELGVTPRYGSYLSGLRASIG
jgi:nucleoside-diphosphate-sugar epimerase